MFNQKIFYEVMTLDNIITSSTYILYQPMKSFFFFLKMVKTISSIYMLDREGKKFQQFHHKVNV